MMRVSIWQQFSSNHSGFYWVVGTFKTVEDAFHAYDEIRKLLQQIDAYHREHPHAIEDAWKEGGKLLPPEKEFAEKYGIEWPHTIDWANWGSYYLEGHPMLPGFNAHQSDEVCINHAVRVTQNLVFAENPDQTWMTMQPFKGLLEHFGAETFAFDLNHLEGWEKSFIQVSTQAPSAEKAEKLRQLDAKLSLKELNVQQSQDRLVYTFQVTTFDNIAGLVAVLKSNGCKEFHISLLKRD